MTNSDTARMALSSRLLLSGTTALALAFMAPQVFAQDAPGEEISDIADEDMDEVVATGIRSALRKARDLKRDADTAVDSITASDVSTLPDLSVAEALARIPGVVVQRIALGASEGDFPSPEGGGNLIRGLTLVRSEFNGRDAFSANGGRSLDFGTIPPELIGAVDVYKNTSADLIEGGIGGSINLRTLEPFDRSGRIAVITLDGTYTDLRDEWSPDYSILLGDRWQTDAGEFGLLGSFSSSELKSDLHGFQIGQLVPYTQNGQTVAVPSGFQLRTNDVDRERDSYYLAGQYRNNDGTLEATAKYSRIENTVDSNERTLEYFTDGESWNQIDVTGMITSPFSSAGIPQCQGENDPTPDNPTCEMTQPVTGLYESGLISNSLRDWTNERANEGFGNGANFTNLGINQQDSSKTDDLSLNVKWRPSDQWFVQVDGHRTTAEFDRKRLWAGSRFFSDFNFNADLDDPYVTLILDPEAQPIRRAGGGAPLTGDLTNPANSFFLFMADEFQDNEGDMYAVRGDVEYEFENDGWFDSIKFGARFAERDQTNREAGLNWAAVAPPWAGGYLPFSEVSSQSAEVVDFSDFFRGGLVRGANTQVTFADRNLLADYEGFVSAIAGESSIPQSVNGDGLTSYGDWNPLMQNGVVDYAGRGGVGDITEKTQNYYARLDFGNEFDNGMSIDANVGVRYTKSDVSGQGALRYNEVSSGNAVGQRPVDFSPEAVAYFTQADIERSGKFSSDERWLPSLNVKWNLNDSQLIRFAVSENITRPNIAQLRPDQSANGAFRFESTTDPTVPQDQRIVDISLNQINIYGGNPDLKPILSTNYDLSYEYYFGDENSLTASFFRKDIRNNIIYASKTLDTVTLDGDEVAIVFNGDVNQDKAEINGVEIAYQQFYDFLPGFLSNLGLQANYTYIDASTNAPIASAVEGDPEFNNFERVYRYGVTNFLGLSEHSANLIGIYQSDKVEVRLAYNWRSEYLSSYRDYVTGNPIFQEDRGYLDGSFKYDFDEHLQFRFQIANILDTKANATQQIDAAGQRFGRTSFVGDRRIRVGLRYAF
ncbi:MAG: TonB-dependent receptor [Litorimonas sp.]